MSQEDRLMSLNITMIKIYCFSYKSLMSREISKLTYFVVMGRKVVQKINNGTKKKNKVGRNTRKKDVLCLIYKHIKVPNSQKINKT